MAVPRPGALSTSRAPSSWPTRSRMARNPNESVSAAAASARSGSNPTPSSAIRSRTASSSRVRRMPTRAAPACWATLARAPWAMRSSAVCASIGSDASSSTSTSIATPSRAPQSRARRSSAGPRPLSRRGGDSSRMKRRVSASPSAAVSRARRTCARPGLVASARSAACSSIWMLESPCATVSWISRASRARSARMPCSRSAAARRSRVASSSAMSASRSAARRSSAA